MNTVTFKGTPLHLVGSQPAVGQKAPDFTLAANDMSPRSLKDYDGKVLVLLSVPSLDTPVCDMEVRRFNKEAAALSDKVCIVAISCDLPFAQARWCGAAGVQRRPPGRLRRAARGCWVSSLRSTCRKKASGPALVLC